jgi:hypothetical protein
MILFWAYISPYLGSSFEKQLIDGYQSSIEENSKKSLETAPGQDLRIAI